MILESIAEARSLGARSGPCCKLLGIDVRTVQRWLKLGPDGGDDGRRGASTSPANALTEAEQGAGENLGGRELHRVPRPSREPDRTDTDRYGHVRGLRIDDLPRAQVLMRHKMAAYRGRKHPPKRWRMSEDGRTSQCAQSPLLRCDSIGSTDDGHRRAGQ